MSSLTLFHSSTPDRRCIDRRVLSKLYQQSLTNANPRVVHRHLRDAVNVQVTEMLKHGNARKTGQ
jgi:hypothetical protein